jgi:hypothetical protein
MSVDTNTGFVRTAEMLKSTGHKVLDDAAIRAFSQWRFARPVAPVITRPVTFRHHPQSRNFPSNQSMKPTAPSRNKFSVFATIAVLGLEGWNHCSNFKTFAGDRFRVRLRGNIL